jgi:hypothetical protein
MPGIYKQPEVLKEFTGINMDDLTGYALMT